MRLWEVCLPSFCVKESERRGGSCRAKRSGPGHVVDESCSIEYAAAYLNIDVEGYKGEVLSVVWEIVLAEFSPSIVTSIYLRASEQDIPIPFRESSIETVSAAEW